MGKKFFAFIIFAALITTLYFTQTTDTLTGLTVEREDELYTFSENEPLEVLAWNLQIFGQSKASNEQLLISYADIIDDYDIIVVQEIRDKEETAFPKLCAQLQNYNCITSSRAGTTSSKEQYGIITKKSLTIDATIDYNIIPYTKQFERPPFAFIINNITFVTLHAKPDNVQMELYALEAMVSELENVLIIGDLNADCSYYNEYTEREFDSWQWSISGSEDTTTSATNCAYDRIISKDVTIKESGIITEGITPEMSDHYPIYAIIN